MAIDREKLDKWFKDPDPVNSGSNEPRTEEVRHAAKTLATSILQNTPPSADQSTAIRYVRSAYLWSVESISHE